MNSRAIAGVLLLGTIFLGFIRLFAALREEKRKTLFTNEYTSRFMQFAQAEQIDGSAYTWLLRNSVRMQREIGIYGIGSFKQPGSLQHIQGYEVIVNLLPEIMDSKADRFDITDRARVLSRTYWETLARYSGVLEERLAETLKQTRNPFRWLQTGVQTILSLPLFVLHWLGLIGTSALAGLQDAVVVKILTGLVTLVGLPSAIATIAVGWPEFQGYIVSLWEAIFG